MVTGDAPSRPLTQQCQRPLFQVKVHQRIHITVRAQAVDLHAKLPEGGVTAFERKVAQVRHGETPFAIGRPTSNDKSGRGVHGQRIEASCAGVGGISIPVRNSGQGLQSGVIAFTNPNNWPETLRQIS